MCVRSSGAILITVVLLAQIAHAGDASRPIQSDQDASFVSQLQSWVDGNFRRIGEDKTRYVLRRIGCDIKSGTNDEKSAGKGTGASVQDDITRCKTKKDGFYCKAAIAMVANEFVDKNDIYYDYCKTNGR